MLKKIFKNLYMNTILFALYKIGSYKFTILYIRLLKKLGLNIGKPIYIDYTAYIDSADYSLITIKDNVVISRKVSILTHDYSPARAFYAVEGVQNFTRVLKEVYIGENSFIGMNSIILPGSHIGKNCIIGAGSVIKGDIADNSVYVGNPAKRICSIEDIYEKYKNYKKE